MNKYFAIFLVFTCLIIIAYFCILILQKRLEVFEKKLMLLFARRGDIFPGLYEVSKQHINRHEEIFHEALLLRKQEFWLMSSQRDIEWFVELQSHIHHEINFIFQVCNKNPWLIKDKNFLYLRDTMISISSDISQEMKKYRRLIEIYNTIIFYKNCTVIWLIIPFYKKAVL